MFLANETGHIGRQTSYPSCVLLYRAPVSWDHLRIDHMKATVYYIAVDITLVHFPDANISASDCSFLNWILR